jgi:hypothetical protein
VSQWNARRSEIWRREVAGSHLICLWILIVSRFTRMVMFFNFSLETWRKCWNGRFKLWLQYLTCSRWSQCESMSHRPPQPRLSSWMQKSCWWIRKQESHFPLALWEFTRKNRLLVFLELASQSSVLICYCLCIFVWHSVFGRQVTAQHSLWQEEETVRRKYQGSLYTSWS